MRYLLVGGTGYLGSELAAQLHERGHDVTVVGRSEPPSSITQQFISWDASTEFLGSPPEVDVVVHLASSNGDTSLRGLDEYLRNIAVTRNILSLCSAISGCAIMYISSIQVFGHWDGEVCRESPVAPLSDYALSHLIAEQSVMTFARIFERPSILLRMSHAIGRGRIDEAIRWGTVPADFCRQVVESGEIQLRSNGTQQRDFIDVSEACGRLVEVLEDVTAWDGSVRMIASGKGTSIHEIAEVVSQVSDKALGLKVRVRLGTEVAREGSGILQIQPDTWNSILLSGPSRSRRIEDSIESLLWASVERWGRLNPSLLTARSVREKDR